MDRVKTTNEYMRSRLREFTKDELIDGILALQFTTMESIVNRCEYNRIMKEQKEDEQREKQFLAEREELRKITDEYNILVKKAREQGLDTLSLEECNRMLAILDRVDEIQKGWKRNHGRI